MSGSAPRLELPTTEGSSPIDLGAMNASEIATAMLRAEAAMPAAVEPELPAIAEAIDAVAQRLAAAGRLVLVGAGTSGRLALIQSSEVGPTFGLAPGVVVAVLAGLGTSTDPRDPIATDDAAEDDAAADAGAIVELGVGPADAVVGIAASGRTPFTVAALETAANRGALTVAVACVHPSPLARAATVAIHPVVGPELLAGSTRLVAGSATKLVLDMLTTGVMIRLGRVHRNRMVDVRAANAKLRERAVRIVADPTGRDADEARAALESVGWWSRAAILRLELGLDQTPPAPGRPPIGFSPTPSPTIPPARSLSMTEPLFVGVDAGASKTVCLVGDAERVLGRGVTGPGNPNVVGFEGHVRAVRESAAAACAAAGLGRPRFARAWLGVAGSERPEMQDRIRAATAEALGVDDVRVSHDASLILPAAGLRAGVALVAGTGSSAFGVGADGRSATVGGWGYLFGDEGSGYELGRLALRAVSHAADGRGPATALTDRILGALDLAEPPELLRRLYPAPPASEVAALASHVLGAAEDGDAVARRLVADTAAELAAIVRACARGVGLVLEGGAPGPSGPVDVVAAGGIVRDGSPVLPALAAALGPLDYRVRRLEAEPALGALELARRPPTPVGRRGQPGRR